MNYPITKYRLAILTSHPIQYQAPLFRKLAAHPKIDLTVYFCWDFGIREEYDPGFGKKIKWDIPLIEGYKYKFLRNYSPKPNKGFLGHINPSIIKELWKNRYDAILVHGYANFTSWLAFLGAWLSRIPIFLRGESHLLNYRPLWKRVIKKVLLIPLFKMISSFLAIGTLNKQYYEYYKVPKEKIFLVPYVADQDFFYEKKKEHIRKIKEIKEGLGIADKEVVILYVGKIFGGKGPGAFDLLKAFERLKSKPAKLIFVGDGKERLILEKYKNKHKIKNIIFTGFVNQNEISKYYAIGDILALPSYHEQWGMVINEAMYFNTAIIASDQVGGAHDLVHHGKNGFIFPAGDVNTLSNYLQELVANRELLQSMKINSSKIIQGWNMNSCVEGVLNALDHVRRRR